MSRSPANVPHDDASAKQTKEYLESWKALGALLHSGRSLSGHERNCCFLNTGQARFANASAATGLDDDADSRAFAPLDWDGDGDLDLWITNRTAPRIQYFQNTSNSGHRFLAIKLQGVACNRDAIGARITVKQNAVDRPLIQTLAAGEGFLSQTSKWFHFGLGTASEIQYVRVDWPGGPTQTFDGIQTNRKYVITQGHQKADLWQNQTPSAPLAAASVTPAHMEDEKRIVPAQRFPIPEIVYQRLDGTWQVANRTGSPTLMNLWASWCQPCVSELTAWNGAADKFRDKGVRVVALNVDHAKNEIGQRELDDVAAQYARLGWTFERGVMDRANAELIEIVQQTLLLPNHALPIPSSLLLDRQGKLAVFYEGPVTVSQLMADLDKLDVDVSDPRDRAVPFRGRWLTEPFPSDLFALPDQLIGFERGKAAYKYLNAHVLNRDRTQKHPDPWKEFGVKTNKVIGVLGETARLLLADGNSQGAIELLSHATVYAPENWDIHVRLVRLLIAGKQPADAIKVSQRMAQLRPQHPLPRNNIAWILATSEDVSIRDAKRAIEIAEDICRQTKFQEPTALDTLAVAYAADGRFEDAVKTAKQALAHCQKLKLDALTEKIHQRLLLYKNQKPFRPSN